jgi:hypothetical protein
MRRRHGSWQQYFTPKTGGKLHIAMTAILAIEWLCLFIWPSRS